MIQQAEPVKRSCPVSWLLDGSAAASPRGMLARTGVLVYGLAAYAAFLAAILYAIGFVENLVVPKSIDSGRPGEMGASLAINTVLLGVFVVQHTIMARPWFKRIWTRLIPEAIERSTFVLAASASLGLVMWQWRPLPDAVWHIDSPWARGALTGVSLTGWAIVFASSFMVSHWDLFGLRQTFAAFLNRRPAPLGFRVVGLYRLVRHPLMLGFLLAVWPAPTMTVGHLFFAGMITAYIFFGTWMEERDLVAHFGERYKEYRRRVPRVLPLPRSRG